MDNTRTTELQERPAGTPGRTPSPRTDGPYELRDEERTRCEIWTRVMGYHRPVAAWNPGKQAEHAERRYYAEPHSKPGDLPHSGPR